MFGIDDVIENGIQLVKYLADDMRMKKCYDCIVQKWAWAKKPFPQLQKADLRRRLFILPKIIKGGLRMTRKFPIKERIIKGYWSLVAMSSVLILTLQPVMAGRTTALRQPVSAGRYLLRLFV